MVHTPGDTDRKRGRTTTTPSNRPIIDIGPAKPMTDGSGSGSRSPDDMRVSDARKREFRLYGEGFVVGALLTYASMNAADYVPHGWIPILAIAIGMVYLRRRHLPEIYNQTPDWCQTQTQDQDQRQEQGGGS